jgi:hypothetical protein
MHMLRGRLFHVFRLNIGFNKSPKKASFDFFLSTDISSFIFKTGNDSLFLCVFQSTAITGAVKFGQLSK